MQCNDISIINIAPFYICPNELYLAKRKQNCQVNDLPINLLLVMSLIFVFITVYKMYVHFTIDCSYSEYFINLFLNIKKEM